MTRLSYKINSLLTQNQVVKYKFILCLQLINFFFSLIPGNINIVFYPYESDTLDIKILLFILRKYIKFKAMCFKRSKRNKIHFRSITFFFDEGFMRHV